MGSIDKNVEVPVSKDPQEPEYEYYCQSCDEPATKNVVKVFGVYDILVYSHGLQEFGEFNVLRNLDEDESDELFCDNCYKNWLEG